MIRPNLRIIGVEEREELQHKGPENMLNKIIEENFSNLKKNIPMKVQEAYRTLNRLNKPSPRHVIIKTQNIQNKERILKAAKEKSQVTCKWKPIRIIPDKFETSLVYRASSRTGSKATEKPCLEKTKKKNYT